ncbi:MAG TPA: cytochrome c-type biogenesis protein [Steroidobacteraceae bacterium]|nr:cytochrome c-type biogenesis protein [Steroidobacteraceae bacterium]
MKPLSRVILFLALAVGASLQSSWAIDAAPAFSDPVQQARYERLASELRCLVCQNETIKDSNADLAADLRRELREQLQAGKSDAEIRQFLTDRYGDFVLYKPPLTARTVLLWAAPLLLLLIGLIAAGVVIVRRSRLPLADDDVDGSEAKLS